MWCGSERSDAAKRAVIFVVESDEVVRSALQFILEDANETHAFAGLDLALVKAAEVKPDIMLVGFGLVQAGGERTLRHIAMRLPGTKILIVADAAQIPLARASLKWGAHDVLGKPIGFDAVRRKVDDLLDRTSSLRLLALLPQSAAW